MMDLRCILGDIISLILISFEFLRKMIVVTNET